jgi:hypothetical protein
MSRFAILLALTLSALAQANDDSIVRRQYDEQAAAVNTSNPKRIFATMDPSFTQVTDTGKNVKFAEYKKGLGQLFAAFKSGTMKFKLSPITYVHGTAIVDYDVEGDLTTRNGMKFHDVERGRDTWKKVGGTYLQVHEVIKYSKFTRVGGRGSATSA